MQQWTLAIAGNAHNQEIIETFTNAKIERTTILTTKQIIHSFLFASKTYRFQSAVMMMAVVVVDVRKISSIFRLKSIIMLMIKIINDILPNLCSLPSQFWITVHPTFSVAKNYIWLFPPLSLSLSNCYDQTFYANEVPYLDCCFNCPSRIWQKCSKWYNWYLLRHAFTDKNNNFFYWMELFEWFAFQTTNK